MMQVSPCRDQDRLGRRPPEGAAARVLARRLCGTAVGMALLAAAAGPASASRRSANADVRIVSFADIKGELVGHAGQSRPAGGLARHAYLVDSLRATGASVLLLNGGGLAPDVNTVDMDARGAQARLRATWRALESMDVQATVPGESDLAQWSAYAGLVEGGRIPVLAANLTVTVAGQAPLAFEHERVFLVDGVRIGVFALVAAIEEDRRHPAAGDGPEFPAAHEMSETRAREWAGGVRATYASAITEARIAVARLERDAEVVVLISRLPAYVTEALVRSVPGIDVAIQGARADWQPEASLIDRTIFNQSGIGGRFWGELELIVDPRGEVIDWGARNSRAVATGSRDEALAEFLQAVDDSLREPPLLDSER